MTKNLPGTLRGGLQKIYRAHSGKHSENDYRAHSGKPSEIYRAHSRKHCQNYRARSRKPQENYRAHYRKHPENYRAHSCSVAFFGFISRHWKNYEMMAVQNILSALVCKITNREPMESHRAMGPWKALPPSGEDTGESAAWNSTRGPIRSRGTQGSQMGGTGVNGLFLILQGRPGFDSSSEVLGEDREPKKIDVSRGGWERSQGLLRLWGGATRGRLGEKNSPGCPRAAPISRKKRLA